MKNTIVNRSTVNLAVVALLTLLFAGSAVASPRTKNLSMATSAAHVRNAGPAKGKHVRNVGPAKGNTDDLQPNPSDSPEFDQWGAQIED